MSGDTCGIEKGDNIVVNGKKRTVKDYYFTSSDEPYVPNTDQLWLVFENGEKWKYDWTKVKGVKQRKKPKIKKRPIQHFDKEAVALAMKMLGIKGGRKCKSKKKRQKK